jgi:hypothetical protein
MDEDEVLRAMEVINANTELLDILSDGDTACYWTY